jgi:hypothetical protein
VRILCLALALASVVAAADAHPGAGIVVDRSGTVYFVDTGSGVYKIGPGGALVRWPGPAFHWMAIDQTNRFANVRLPSTPDAEMRAGGTNPTLILSSDFPIVIGRDGGLYFAEYSDRLRIVRFMPDGTRSVRATLPGALRWVNGIASGPDGAIYYTEDNAVRKIDARGAVSTVAANVAVPNCARIPGAEQPYLRGLAVDTNGNVFVAASGCGAVLKITPRGAVSVVLRTTTPWSATDVAVSPAGLYVLEYLHTASDNRREWLPRVRRVAPNGAVTTVAAISGR